MADEPVFIVGIPRSGTTLLAAQLAAHSRLSCGPETHFFRWLSKVDPQELCAAEQWPMAATQFIGAIKYRQFSEETTKPLLQKYDVTIPEVETFLKKREPAISTILASITVPYMRSLGKSRWVEKTPDHLPYVRLIRQYFPDSPILRIVRDPRDVALSLMRVPWGAETFPSALLHLNELEDTSADFFRVDKRSHVVRFEDLLSDPRFVLRQICEFIGETFEEEMLNTSVSGKRVNSRNAPWKNKASQPLDRDRIAVWRKEIGPQDNVLAEAIVGSILRRYHYPQTKDFPRLGELFPSKDIIVKYSDEVKHLTAQGIRFWPISEEETPTVRVYAGNPSYIEWLGEEKRTRLVRALSIMARIIRSLLSGEDVYWITDKNISNWSGILAQAIMLLLKPHRLSAETRHTPN